VLDTLRRDSSSSAVRGCVSAQEIDFHSRRFRARAGPLHRMWKAALSSDSCSGRPDPDRIEVSHMDSALTFELSTHRGPPLGHAPQPYHAAADEHHMPARSALHVGWNRVPVTRSCLKSSGLTPRVPLSLHSCLGQLTTASGGGEREDCVDHEVARAAPGDSHLHILRLLATKPEACIQGHG
jgi:hypothetical protein